jgi:hypothetical protein
MSANGNANNKDKHINKKRKLNEITFHHCERPITDLVEYGKT